MFKYMNLDIAKYLLKYPDITNKLIRYLPLSEKVSYHSASQFGQRLCGRKSVKAPSDQTGVFELFKVTRVCLS